MRTYQSNGKKIHLLEVYDGSAMYISSFIVQILLQVVLMVILSTTGVNDSFSKSMAGICLFGIVNEIAIGTAPLIYSKIRSANLYRGIGFKTKTDWRQWLIVIGIAFATVATFAPIANYFADFVIWTGFNPDTLSTMKIDSPATLALGLIVLSAIPAICEEFLYRGMIARSFADGGMIFGLLTSSALFAIMHGNPVQLLHQFCLGCICAAVYFMTRNIWMSVLVHFLNNAVAVIGNYILGSYGLSDTDMPWYIALTMIVVGGAILTVLLWLFAKISARVRGKSAEFEAVRDVKSLGEKRLAILYENDDERSVKAAEEAAIQRRLESCETPEMREVMLIGRQEEESKIRRRSRMSVLFAFVAAMVVWLVNTVSGYML